MEIGNKILHLRKENNMNQEQLAERIGVARQTISKWELGETSPDLKQAKLLAQIFNASLDELSDNDIKIVLIRKISNIENLTKIIYNILRIILLFIITMIIVLISIIYFREYFDVKPVNAMRSIECSIDGINYSYEVWQNNETSYIIDKIVTNDKDLNIDVREYINFDKILNDIKDDVISRGGICN